MRRRTTLILLSTACFGFNGLTGTSAAQADPGPVALDPQISSLLVQVSQDSLQAHVQALQSFHTRNTVSDTISTTMGVGAARRWVHDRFAERGATAGYFDWNAPACAVAADHRNVTGTFTGSEPNRLIVVGAHLDSRSTNTCDGAMFAPGANDDASGVACLVELARLLPSLSLETSVVLQAFTGEEQGLFGSSAYAREARMAGYDIDAMINNDTIGNIDGCPNLPDCGGGSPTAQDSLSVRAFSGDPSTGASRQLARLAKLIGEAYVSEMTVHLQPAIDRPDRGGDHIPFHNEGFPSMRFIETLEYTLQQHNEFDVIDEMEFSYHRRNVLMNLALIANLALAPERPTDVQAFDLGTGGGIRVNWAPVTGDVAGYRVAYRFYDTGDTLYYEDVVDAGTANTLDLTGLTDEITLAVSVSAYDAAGHESVFSEEQLITPGTTPHVPTGFRAASRSDHIELTWNTPAELDIDRFRIWRSILPTSGFAVLDSVDAPALQYDDVTANPGTDYYYKLSSIDLTELESPQTAAEKGRLATYQPGLLVVDGTRNGTGITGNPNDAQIDDYYDSILPGAFVLATWDWLAQNTSGNPLTDAEMGQYQTVFVHSDLRNSTIGNLTEELRQYVAGGGQLFLGGWELKTRTGSATEITEYQNGDFFFDVMKVPALRTAVAGEADFEGADPLEAGYPILDVDTSKWPFSFGKLTFMDAIVGSPLDGAAAIEAYRSSEVPPGPNDGLPVGLKWPAVDPQVIFLDVPLYFMEQTGAQAFIDQLVLEFGYVASDVPSSPGVSQAPRALTIEARPNPASGRIEFVLELPSRSLATLQVFDVSGRAVRDLADHRELGPGLHSIAWDGRDTQGRSVATGVYFAQLKTGNQSVTRALRIVR